MKSIKLLLIGLAAAFALTGCGDSKDTPEPEGDGSVLTFQLRLDDLLQLSVTPNEFFLSSP